MNESKSPLEAKSSVITVGVQSKNEVTLSGAQTILCRTVLSQSLMKVAYLLKSGKDSSGNDLTTDGLRELLGFSSRLQLTLIELGLTSAEVANIIHDFGKDPQ
jgi:hypothetical protein